MTVGPPTIEQVLFEPEFKAVIDGLLPLIVSPLVRTFGAAGSDGGVDADYNGAFANLDGYWVFQYKFRNPTVSGSTSRNALKRSLTTTLKTRKSGFARVKEVLEAEGEPPPVAYVLVTNIEATPQWVRALRRAWREVYPNSEFCCWDRSRLNTELRTHTQLTVNRTKAMADMSHAEVVMPMWEWARSFRAKAEKWESRPFSFLELREKNGRHAIPLNIEVLLPILDAAAPLQNDAFNVSWRHALLGYLPARVLVEQATNESLLELNRVATKIRSLSSWPSDLVDAWDENAEGMALELLSSAVKGDELSIRFDEQEGTIRLGSETFLKGPVEELKPFFVGLKRIFAEEKRSGAPSALCQWGPKLRQSGESFVNQLWYAGVLHIDAPQC